MQLGLTRVAATRALVLLLLALLSLSSGPTPVQAAEKLVPARFGSRMDKSGYAYTLDANGRVRVRYGWLYSAFTFTSGGFNIQKREMTANGEEFVFSGTQGQLTLQRRLRVSPQMAGIRIVESLSNPTGRAITTTLVIHSQPNWPYQSVLTDRGRAATGMLTKKEGGVVCHMQQPMQLLTCFQLASPRAKVKPTLVTMNNHQLQFHYQLNVPARGRVSIVHGATVAPQGSPPAANRLPTLFKGMRNAHWLRDLPKEIRTTLVNSKRGHGFGDADPLPPLAALLDVEPGTVDRLAYSDETLLQGTATCQRLTVTAAYGDTVLPLSQVAAIVGRRAPGRRPGVYLRDGQHMTGRILAEGLRFELTSGMTIDLEVDGLDRLVMRDPVLAAARARGESPPEADREDAYFLFETFRGDRLRASQDGDALHVVTSWGELRVPSAEIERVHIASGETPGYSIWLGNGSRFRAFLGGKVLQVRTDQFGTIPLPVAELRRVLAIHPGALDQEEDRVSSQPHILLAGGARLVGRIGLDALHFLSPAGLVPQPPAQVRVLRAQDTDGTEAPDRGRRFRADFWGGGHLTGEMKEVVIPFQTAHGTLAIPVREIVEVHMPTPVVPAAVRMRIRGLIADLGHTRWETREAASAALADLGELARSALNQARGETKDPEVERRVRRLLDRL